MPPRPPRRHACAQGPETERWHGQGTEPPPAASERGAWAAQGALPAVGGRGGASAAPLCGCGGQRQRSWTGGSACALLLGGTEPGPTEGQRSAIAAWAAETRTPKRTAPGTRPPHSAVTHLQAHLPTEPAALGTCPRSHDGTRASHPPTQPLLGDRAELRPQSSCRPREAPCVQGRDRAARPLPVDDGNRRGNSNRPGSGRGCRAARLEAGFSSVHPHPWPSRDPHSGLGCLLGVSRRRRDFTTRVT